MRTRVAVFAVVFSLLPAMPALAVETCEALSADIEALGADAAPADLADAFDSAMRLDDCTDDFRMAVGRRAASATAREVNEAVEAGAALAGFQAPLEESLTRFRLWQTLAMLADIAYDKADYELSTRRYQEALEAIDDEELTGTPPQAEIIDRLFHRAEETRLVAAAYVSLPPFRDGRPRALSDPDIRGYTPAQAAWPITFETGSAQLTQKGLAAIEDLWIQMSYEDFPDITLVGYTDTRGSRGANHLLSERRAQVVADHLRERGYPGQVVIEGRGENTPYKPLDPSHYSEEELLSMSRRVDLVR